MSRQQVSTSYGTIEKRNGNTRTQGRTYIEGNTVRKLNTAPQRMPREQESQEKREQRHVSHQTRANRERAMQMNPGYILFLAAAVFLTAGVCALYIQLQSEVSSRMRNIASLESRILDLKTDNDAALNRIETSVNLEEIKNKAINEMGMVYPGQEQLIYFTVDTNDYMNQYQDIPEK